MFINVIRRSAMMDAIEAATNRWKEMGEKK